MKINIRAFTSEQLNTMANMIAWMEVCGNIGHSSTFTVKVDGDGNGKIKAVYDNEQNQQEYDFLKHKMLQWYQSHGSEEPIFTFGE